jgi:hypothetical protein
MNNNINVDFEVNLYCAYSIKAVEEAEESLKKAYPDPKIHPLIVKINFGSFPYFLMI